MKIVYCSNCGTRLNVLRKAMPKYGAVINVVEFHECPDEIAELDLTPVDIPSFDPPEDKDQFVQKLNELSPLSPLAMSEPGDRRGKEFIKSDATSSAPENLLNNIGDMQNTAPENEPTGDPEDV